MVRQDTNYSNLASLQFRYIGLLLALLCYKTYNHTFIPTYYNHTLRTHYNHTLLTQYNHTLVITIIHLSSILTTIIPVIHSKDMH